MWQERRPSTQSPSPRTASPLPRRPTLNTGSQSARPGALPRSSSLSLVSSPSTSTTNLGLTLRHANGSTLRHELRAEPSFNTPDPLQVLESILGGKLANGQASDARGRELGDDELQDLDDINWEGLSLEQFASERGPEMQNGTSNKPAFDPAEWDREKTRFEELHKSIKACDQVLKSVETYLVGFQADLGAVSTEIETLQSRSTSLNSKLERRRVVEKLLGPSVEELGLSPEVVRSIVDGPIDDSWIYALAELDKRCKAVKAKSKEQKQMKALEDLEPLLENLTNKAVSRIRDYIVAQIKALRSPNMNAQVIQQQGFLRFKDLYTFLASHQPQLGSEICQAYVNTMRWYYLSQFTRYEAALRQIKLHTIDKTDLIGSADDPTVRRAKGPPAAHDAFSIGRRMDVIKTTSSSAIASHVAEEDKSSHYLEVVFRSFNVAIVDNASFEYTFLSSFFSPAQNFHTIRRTFDSIFTPTFKLGQELTKSLVENSADAIGILLCVRLNQQFAFDFQKRKVPPGEGYINATSMLLWPRFQIIMDLHCESLRKLSATAQSTAPHPITQRFASFLQAILKLSSETGDDEPVSRSLGRLSTDYESLITKLSKSIGDTRKRERFLSNNYSLIVTILEEGSGKLADENRQHFLELRKAYGDSAVK
ncbi:Vps52-domain-containing protein [Microthyrium microscopicum]|uniref:Vps52-domain-containing protein n=1 Tax=Microthyrium microscopicum TaxID=703497 RepID=A0A6A6TW93_9PEZI|nr:Vps52-domain-containing protein [Microthyrium microscopicum]